MSQPVLEPLAADELGPKRTFLKLAYAWRGVLGALPILVAAVIPWHLNLDPRETWIPGVALVAIAWALRTWAQCHLGYRLRARKTFVGCGPYAWVRNPIYIANTAMIVGTVMACGTLWFMPAALGWCARLYSAVVRHEDWLLSLHYGKPYIDYLAESSRWIPHRDDQTPLRSQACRHDRLGRAIVAELHTPLILVPAVMKWLVLRLPLA
jgi:protein-S-isoprenylcysteine O-methyltransferase Ste14